MALAARWFQDRFKDDVLYAVKANPSPWVIKALVKEGICAFDVASIPEIELVAEHAPRARMAFMHPVKSRKAISAAYVDYGVRTFSLDSHEELAKIIDATGYARDLNLMVRLSAPNHGSAYPLSGKFGIEPWLGAVSRTIRFRSRAWPVASRILVSSSWQSSAKVRPP